jgi:hypothetical protein
MAHQPQFSCPAEAEPIVRELGLTAEGVFTRPDIVVWRTLPDRENCYLDATVAGQAIRLHIKRYPAGRKTPANDDVRGLVLLKTHQIPTAPLIAHGRLADGRSFVILRDLAGYTPGDKLIAAGAKFGDLIVPTADLAARLHNASLHHRDLYLCHFMVKPSGDPLVAPALALIDTARVATMRRFFSGRWVVKDLAQFWYSTTKLPITDEQRDAWLKRYAEQRGLPGCAGLKSAVLRKVDWIARHDRSLNQKQPGRNVSIPGT